MKDIKRIIIGLACATPIVVFVSYLIHLFIIDPNMIKTIKIAWYCTFGIFVILGNLLFLLSLFSLSIFSLKILLRIKPSDKMSGEGATNFTDKVE